MFHQMTTPKCEEPGFSPLMPSLDNLSNGYFLALEGLNTILSYFVDLQIFSLVHNLGFLGIIAYFKN